MRQNPWEELLDELYEMGGRAEYLSEDTEITLDETVNLVDRMELSQEEIERASETLQKMDLIKATTVGHSEGEGHGRNELILTGDGFDFSHNRQQEQRNIRSNRSITLLTLVLAFVGMAQATALTANVSQMVTGTMAASLTFGSGGILLVIYVALYRTGMLDIEDVAG